MLAAVCVHVVHVCVCMRVCMHVHVVRVCVHVCVRVCFAGLVPFCYK